MQTTLLIQRELASRGLYKGALDGIYGDQTAEAVWAALKPANTAKPSSDGWSGSIATLQPKATRPINEIIVHCTATPEGRAVTVSEIRAWHKAKGWKDIGYHWVVLLDGSLKPGRPEAEIGSHVAGHNTGTLGIVYVGGVEKDGKTPKDTRTAGQKATLMAAVKALIVKYPTIKKVTGHNAYAPKACPSFRVELDPLGKLV